MQLLDNECAILFYVFSWFACVLSFLDFNTAIFGTIDFEDFNFKTYGELLSSLSDNPWFFRYYFLPNYSFLINSLIFGF